MSCSELDAPTREWAERNRPDPRVTYCDMALDAAPGRGFEVVVALELIEHVNAFGPFLKSMAPVAILSTPNKLRDAFSAVRTVPDYDEHLRGWTAGEFYWVLKAFWTMAKYGRFEGMRSRPGSSKQADPSFLWSSAQACGNSKLHSSLFAGRR